MEASRVLDYAPPPPSSARLRVLRRMLASLTIVLLAAALGATIGFELTPSVRFANQYYQVNLPRVRQVTSNEIASSLDGHVSALQTPESFDAVLTDVRSRGITAPSGEAGRALLKRNLKIVRIPNSTVIGVSFASRDAALADAIVSAVEREGVRQTVFGVPPTRLGTSSGTHRSTRGAVAGGLVAACATLILVCRLRHTPATAEPRNGGERL